MKVQCKLAGCNMVLLALPIYYGRGFCWSFQYCCGVCDTSHNNHHEIDQVMWLLAQCKLKVHLTQSKTEGVLHVCIFQCLALHCMFRN